MAIKKINVGNAVNDGSGDDLRSAFVKVNENFDDLNNRQDNIATNIGTGIGLFKEKVGIDLRFKSIVVGNGISVTGNTNTITITNTDHALINELATNNGNDHDLILELNDILHTYDFGIIGTPTTNVIQFILQSMTTDLGSITSPGSINLDLGILNSTLLDIPSNLNEIEGGGSITQYTYLADSGTSILSNFSDEFDGGTA
jgi:hypothetical protein